MDELEFIQQCISGKEKAWDLFLDKYSRLIYNYIHSVLKLKGLSFNPANLEDLFQEVIFSLIKDNFKKLASFKGINSCSFASWLRQVVVNFTLDYVKMKRDFQSLDENSDGGLGLKDRLADSSLPVTSGLSDKENQKQLYECIEGLVTEDRYFLRLHIEKLVSLEKLKDVMKLSRGAIDMRKKRIIQKLRDCFKSKGFLLDF